jgi:creatinine amidohydrolase
MIATGRLLAELTSTQIAAVDKSRAIVIQPIGAIEQHGAHLPVVTDALVAERLAIAAADALGQDGIAWVLPTLSYGKSTEHLGRAGTLALSTSTLLGICADLGGSLAQSGFTRLVFINGHGGQPSLLDVAARDIRKATGLHVFNIMTSRLRTPPGLELTDAAFGLHGGELETSIMLALAPQLVHLEHAVEDGRTIESTFGAFTRLSLEGAIPTAWLIDDLTDSGILGDPRNASAELGERIIAHWTAELAGALNEIASFTFPIR